MSAQTFCLYIHNNKSILCLPVLNPADSWCASYKASFLTVYTCILGGAVMLIRLS